MLEYFKTILAKVSFDQKLFKKELRKALSSLVPKEIAQLKDWCYTQFSQHQLVLNECFAEN